MIKPVNNKYILVLKRDNNGNTKVNCGSDFVVDLKPQKINKKKSINNLVTPQALLSLLLVFMMLATPFARIYATGLVPSEVEEEIVEKLAVGQPTQEEVVTEETQETQVPDSHETQVPDSNASTTEEVTEKQGTSVEEIETNEGENLPNISHSENDHKYAFNDTECVLVRDGEFYCVKKQSGNEGTSVEENIDNGSVSVKKDVDGDKEIFFSLDGVETQITNNVYDDDFPVYDSVGKTIAWHTLINNRQQVVIYDIDSGVTKQITDSAFNNSNPHIYGDYLVWQGWSGNDWDIFYTNISESEMIINQITDNDYHDMFPQVYGKLITWQSSINNSWKVFVYNIEDGSSKIVGDGNGKYEAPRFILLFENRNENGDVEKIGYEIDSGKKMELGVTAKNHKLPEPIVPEDPINEQEKTLPTVSSTTTVKTVAKDGSGEEEE